MLHGLGFPYLGLTVCAYVSLCLCNCLYDVRADLVPHLASLLSNHTDLLNNKQSPVLSWIPPFLWYLIKVMIFIFVYIWFRGTFPRYRFDQLMGLGWKVLLPVSLVNVMAIALGVLLLGGPR